MIWTVIKTAMVRNHINSFVELAQITGIAPATLTQTRRKDPGSFKLYELAQIDRVLHFTNTEWLQVREKL